MWEDPYLGLATKHPPLKLDKIHGWEKTALIFPSWVKSVMRWDAAQPNWVLPEKDADNAEV